jgi:hypothetical protein
MMSEARRMCYVDGGDRNVVKKTMNQGSLERLLDARSATRNVTPS